MVLEAALLNTQHCKVRHCKVRAEWRNPGNGEAPSPTHRCRSYWKGSLQVALDYGRQLDFYLFIKFVFFFFKPTVWLLKLRGFYLSITVGRNRKCIIAKRVEKSLLQLVKITKRMTYWVWYKHSFKARNKPWETNS